MLKDIPTPVLISAAMTDDLVHLSGSGWEETLWEMVTQQREGGWLRWLERASPSRSVNGFTTPPLMLLAK